MFALVVRFDVAPGRVEEFDRLVAEASDGIAEREPRTVVYARHTVPGEPGVRVFYEVYRDREAFEEHEAQPHMQPFLTRVADLVTRPARVELLEPTSAKGLPS